MHPPTPLPQPSIEVIAGPNDLKIYHVVNKGKVAEPLPCLFYLALSGEESLTLDPYNQPVAFLASENVHIFSFTLPCHGPGFENKEAMECWAKEISEGHDILGEFIEKAHENIQFLIKNKWIDSSRIAVAGLSRGCFVAAHLAAKGNNIQTVLGYAPLIELASLDEFHSLEANPIIEALNLRLCLAELAHRNIRFYIGNRDERVGTRHCFDFIEALAEEALKKRIRSLPFELIIGPSIGHKGHGTSTLTFQNGINWLKEKLLIVN
jgi:predicted esterase